MIKTVLAYAAVWAAFTGMGLVLSHMAMSVVTPILQVLQ